MRAGPLKNAWVAGCAAISLLLGCAGPSATELELSRIRRELRGVQTELAETKTELARLSNQAMLQSAGRSEPGPSAERAPASDGRPARELEPKKPMPKLPVVRLGRTEDSDSGAQDDGGPPILIKVGPEAGDKLKVDRDVLKRPDPVLGDIPQKKKKPATKAELTAAKTEYEQALGVLRDQHKPSEARALFTAFRAHYPDSELSANAAYWLAECSFAEGKHGRAADEFRRIAEEFPSSLKVPDALLRAGQSYIELKDHAKAGELLRRVKNTYPGSDVATEADKALHAINATEARGDGR